MNNLLTKMVTSIEDNNVNKTLCNDDYQDISSSTAITAILTTISVLGFLANLVTLAILILYKKDFPDVGRILLKNQAISDAFVCIMAIGLIIQTFRWTTGFKLFDFILCQVWHSQALFWGGVHLSIWNLVCIAVERFIKVSYPFKYLSIQQHHIYIACVAIYLSSVVFTIPCYFQSRYDFDAEKCSDQYYFLTDSFDYLMAHYGIFWFVMEYAIPTACFIVLYAKVLWDIRKHKKVMKEVRHLSKQKKNDKCTLTLADRQLTTTSIIVTTVFIITLGVESWRYFLGRIGIICYKKNMLQLIFGIFLASINSCANPFIYTMSLPIFRKCLKQFFKVSSPSNS